MSVIRISWTVDDLADIMSLFDVQKVYRSTLETGPWTEVTTASTRVPLEAGVSDYSFVDTNGLSTYYYTVAYYHSTTTDESDKSEPHLGDVTIRYLTRDDLETVIESHTVTQMFDDDVSGGLSVNENTRLNNTLERAEGHVDSIMMLAYDKDAITTLANNDAAFKFHAAWIAITFGAERRSGFQSEDGSSPYATQFKRAEEFFNKLAKGRRRSAGESAAGLGSNVGGSLKPTLASGQSRFTFAPDDNNPTGHGGF